MTVTNRGSTPTTGWTVTWTFANGERVSQLWNGTFTASGAAVSVTNVNYNAAIPAGGSITFGFLATGTPATTVTGLTCTAK